MDVEINFLALVVAVLANIALGMVWYGPMFGEQWMKLVGKTKEEIENADDMPKTYGIMMVNAVILAFVISHFVWMAKNSLYADQVPTFMNDLIIGIQTGFWAWLGLIATTSLTNAMFADKPMKLWAIDAGYWFAVVLINGMIISLW